MAEFWRALVGRFVAATRVRIETEQAAGRAPEYPAEATAFGLAWMTERAYYQHLVQDGGLADAELTSALAGAWVRAIYGRVE